MWSVELPEENWNYKQGVLKWGKAFIVSTNIWISCGFSCPAKWGFDEGVIWISCPFFEFCVNRQIFRRSTKTKTVRQCCNRESLIVLSSVCRHALQFLFARIWFWVGWQAEDVPTTGLILLGKLLTSPCWPANVLNFKKPPGKDWFSPQMHFIFCLPEKMIFLLNFHRYVYKKQQAVGSPNLMRSHGSGMVS